MSADAAIRKAIDLIDQWVQRRPPGTHYKRTYEIPWRQHEPSSNTVSIFQEDPHLASFIREFHDYRDHTPTIGPGSEADGRKFDAAYFAGMRNELLDEPLREIHSLLVPTLTPDLYCIALTALLYGNIQNLLWQLHVHGTTSLAPQTLAEWGLGAEFAREQLLSLQGLG